MNWFLSGLATGLGLVSMWHYGKKSILGPWLGIFSCIAWCVFIVYTQQYPLLISVVPNLIISFVNLWRMSKNGKSTVRKL